MRKLLKIWSGVVCGLLALPLSIPLSPSNNQAQGVPPVIRPPSILSGEGLERKVTAEQIATLKSFTERSKAELARLRLDLTSISDEWTVYETLRSGFQRILSQSTADGSELYVRIVLNRALEITRQLELEVSNPRLIAEQLKRFMVVSLGMAERYAPEDEASVKRGEHASNTGRGQMGALYAVTLFNLTNSILDESAQLTLYALGHG